jgi:hypothetical protein
LERLKSLGNWLIIIILLIGTAVVAAIWPFVTQNLNLGGAGSFFGGATRPAASLPPIVINIPEPVASWIGMNQLVLESALEMFGAFFVILAIVVGLVIGTGLVITLLMRLGGKFTTEVKESKDYQEHISALEQKEKAALKGVREKNSPPNGPEDYIYGLDPISFSLMVLFFVAMLAMLVYALVSPSGEMTLFGQTFNSGWPLLLIFFIITLPFLFWLVRRSRLNAVADSDGAPIPWDFIAVLITGLLVVGVGIGLMLFLNRPL